MISNVQPRNLSTHRALVLLTTVLLAAGCTSTRSTETTTTPTSRSAVPAAVTDQIRSVIAKFDTAAGQSVTAQQQVLAQLVAPGQVSVQKACPAARNTLFFEPNYADLAPAPDWRPAQGTLPGIVYSLPTFISIFTGQRITGSDLTDLHLSIDQGQVRFTALCLA